MSTNKATTFASMLNEWLVNDLLEQAFKEQSWLWNETNVVKTWQGGKLIVPFQDHYANSIAMGKLSDDADIGDAGYTSRLLRRLQRVLRNDQIQFTRFAIMITIK